MKKTLIIAYIVMGLITVLLSFLWKNELLTIFNLGCIVIIASIFLLKDDNLLVMAMLISNLAIRPIVAFVKILPGITIYLTDYLVFLIFFKVVYYIVFKKINYKTKINKYVFFLFVINMIAFIFNKYNLLNFLWGVRIYYRFFMLYIGIVNLNISNKTIKLFIKIILVWTFIQIPLAIFQYVSGFNMDSIGGTFGKGGSGTLSIYLVSAVSFVVAAYMLKKVNIIKAFVFTFLLVLPILLNESKITFFLIPAIVLTLSINKINFKTVIIGILLSAITIFGVKTMSDVYSYNRNEAIYSKDFLYNYLYKMSYVDGSLNRLSAPEYIYNYAMNDPVKKIFGIGIGNGSPSQFELLQGNYYKLNYTLKYEWFLLPYFMLENGIVGLFTYIFIILILYFESSYIYKHSTNDLEKILALGFKGVIIVALVSIPYNNCLVQDGYGYLFWFIGGIIIKMRRLSNSENNEKNIVK